MKNYRKIMPIVMIFVMAISWYMMVSDSFKQQSEYKKYLTEARDYAEDGITKYAIENYLLALEIKSTSEVYKEVAEYYKSQEKMSDYVSWCEDFLEEYNTDVVAYECALEAYKLEEDYEACYDVLIMADKRNVTSKKIKEIRDELYYVFKVDFGSYDEVGIYSNNYCSVKTDDGWGYVDRYGNLRISTKYTQVGTYTQSAFTSVVNSAGEAYFIDKSGSKVMVSKETYKSFGLLVDGIIAAEQTNGKYVYVNSDFENLFGEYDYASTFNNGIATVKTGEKWKIIDTEGKQITSTEYMDVKLDEKNIAFRNNRAFVSTTSGKYIMVNEKGKQVGKLEFEDAMVFAGEAPTAVKINGKWCFINSDGKLISDKTYEHARAYSNGLAAVCIDGLWGFIDEKEIIVIEPQFYGAKDFNEIGSCFVKVGESWKLLKLYRLNREN